MPLLRRFSALVALITTVLLAACGIQPPPDPDAASPDRLPIVVPFDFSKAGNSVEVDFRVVCSKGFYVRTYAHDIGAELGCGAHLRSLRRTKSGRFDVTGAVTVEELKTRPREEIVRRILSLPEVSRLRGA